MKTEKIVGNYLVKKNSYSKKFIAVPPAIHSVKKTRIELDTESELQVVKALNDLEEGNKLVKKINKPVKNVVLNYMTTVVNQLDLNVFYAIAIKLQLEKSTETDIANAELTNTHAWNQVTRSLDELKLELFKLCKNRKWDLARALLAEFETELIRFLYCNFSLGTVKWYVDESIKKKGMYSETQYLPQFGVVYGQIKGKVKIKPELITEKAISNFYDEISKMASLGLNIVNQLKEDIHNKRYNEKFDKYSIFATTIDDAFISSLARNEGLDILLELSVFDWISNKPELTFMQNWKEEGKRGKKGSGLKRLLGAWLDACDRKGLLNPRYSDTERAKAVLNFFGLPADDNNVREMIGKKAKENGYGKFFENW